MQLASTPNEVDDRLVEIFREVFKAPEMDVRADMTTEDVAGWDSIRMISLLLAIEKGFGVTLRGNEIRRIGSVGDVARLIRSHQG